MGAVSGPSPGLNSLSERKGSRGHVNQAIVGVGLRSEVERAEPGGIHDSRSFTPPESMTGNDVGEAGQSDIVIDCDPTEVEWKMLVFTPGWGVSTDCPEHVTGFQS